MLSAGCALLLSPPRSRKPPQFRTPVHARVSRKGLLYATVVGGSAVTDLPAGASYVVMGLLPINRKRVSPLVDADGIADLYRRQSVPLLRYFARRVFDPDLAADLLAETFAEVLTSRHRFRGETEGELEGWVYAIARTKLAQFLRRGRIEKRALARLGIDAPQLSAEEYERIETLSDLDESRALISEALARLSSDQRKALRLRVVQELPYDEVAVRLGISEQTARARVSRGLRAMAFALDGRLPEGSNL
jgi:RNA polymerase sigma factor (sigma-70 family)